MEELSAFLTNLNQEIMATASAAEEGMSLEDAATRYLLDILESSGSIDAAQVCYDRREDAAGRVMHRLSGYGLSEDGTSVDLFITSFYQHLTEAGGPQTFGRPDLEKAMKQVFNFLEGALKGFKQLEETAPVLSLAHYLATQKQDLLRANIYILTNGKAINAEAVNEERRIRDVLVRYQMWDIERFHRLLSNGGMREPITIDFEAQHGQPIRCLPMPVDNKDYQTWLAIIPGYVIADLYQRHGQRLLERNVRAFLQFGTKVNRGIQKTIIQEPERFLAYNNGLAATAADVTLTPDGSGILQIHDLQIVNGGQTTAAICQTRQQKRDAPLDRVFVQMKLTKLSGEHTTDAFAGLIAEYANTQNAIRQADLSANSPFNMDLERLSRDTWAPAIDRTGKQTRWFFERARGQYKEMRARAGTNKTKFDAANPYKQLFTKDLMAKYRLAWECQPNVVAKGGEKVYAFFRSNLEEGQRPNRAWFEDLVALSIIWREAERLHTRLKLGDARNVVVAYSLAWLSHHTSVEHGSRRLVRLNLPDVWARQGLSPALARLVEALVPRLDRFIRQSAIGTITTEWGKKEASWALVVAQGNLGLTTELAALSDELLEPGTIESRYAAADDAITARQAEIRQMRSELDDIGVEAWRRIAAWGNQLDENGGRMLKAYEVKICDDCTVETFRRKLPEAKVEIAYQVLGRVYQEALEVLEEPATSGENEEEVPELEIPEGAPTEELVRIAPPVLPPLSLEIVRELSQCAGCRALLAADEVESLDNVAAGRQPLNAAARPRLRYIQQKCVSKGHPHGDN
jgi:hypothetical protein